MATKEGFTVTVTVSVTFHALLIFSLSAVQIYAPILLNVCELPLLFPKLVSEYDQEIPQSQTADKPVAPLGRATHQSRDTRKTKKAKQPALSSPSR